MNDQPEQHWHVSGFYRSRNDILIEFHRVGQEDLMKVEGPRKVSCAGRYPNLFSFAHKSSDAFHKDYKVLDMREAMHNIAIVTQNKPEEEIWFDYEPTGDRRYRATIIPNPYVDHPLAPSSKATDGASLNSIDPSNATSGQESSVVTKPPTTADQIEQPPTTDD